MELFETSIVVIGAGVVGLSVAKALAEGGRDVLLLERESLIGSGISSRNSEVIHAGIYYPRGSLKAETCVRGKALLYEYCVSRGIPHKRCGKLIVATHPEQMDALQQIYEAAAANGVTDLQWLTQAQALAMEPELRSVGALYSPSTGIIDSHQYMLSLQGDFERAGGMTVLNAPLLGGRIDTKSATLNVGGAAPCQVQAEVVVNCAGLDAMGVLANVEGYPVAGIPPTYFAKGSYFSLSGRSPFQRLIYPVPEDGGLGVHLTLDIGGQARFGPDVEWIDKPEFSVDPQRMAKFAQAIRNYWPALPEGKLQPAYAGVRPKLSPQGARAEDFVIDTPEENGVAGWYNLFGIESPGLTASLALAEVVEKRVLNG
ncbi:NAD(P)/FAD-dependent oxidoreductase [Hahella sp. HN01]|uniref:NAD(P)/FAD-dependent oxidoreductase n=1 Tax=Hahella sp. HN01 TaxID=2847262 RepID=UPI001C1E9AA5|nr:NAD(P)/FAD-dependent oxidoreductase [Hahella sp. HN01]MBU6950040.1 NAD(P)/FAD-dependent oxidoreductase [Hahella sp. HN01]